VVKERPENVTERSKNGEFRITKFLTVIPQTDRQTDAQTDGQ